jgi:phospholipase C
MGTIADVKHVVVLMQENRSFDHYFGMLRGVRGFFDPAALQQSDGTTVFRQKKPGATPAALYPFHVDAHTTSAETMPSNGHGWTAQHGCWAGGTVTGWRANQPDTAMAYFTRHDIPYHTALAQTFTVCDAYFCSVLGPTSPNRLYLMSGTIDPGGTHGGPATSNPQKDPAPLYHWKSYPAALSDAGVSWAIYDEQAGHPSQPPFDLNVAAYFADWVDSATTHRTGDHRFEQDLANKTLPKVSWIVPPYGYTEHPRFSPTNGAYWVAKKVQALIASPYWSSTVFVLAYDENDGSFDHVPPPTAPAGTADEWVNGQPIGPGFRVPCIVVSPWTVGGRVSTARYDHTSVLRLMETVTGVAAQNISAYRRSALHNLCDALDFSSAVASADVPPLPAAPAYVAADLPDPTVPTSQTWPPSRARRAAIGWLGGHAYFFRGDQYLRYVTGTTGVAQHPEAGYPKSIAGNWPEVTFVDAGCAMPNGKAYVFSGNTYVRYSAPAGNPEAVAGDYTPDPGYPNQIWHAWGGFWAADLDAAVTWPDGFTYFFKGTEYVRCLTSTHVADHAPRPIAQAFPGVIEAFPHGIDAAVVWSATKAYFFKGERYVRYTIGSGVDAGYPNALSAFSPELAAL